MENKTVKCAVCGGELSQFGVRNLSDGLLCRDCCAMLSEWLSEEDTQRMSAADISKHLDYRKRNAKKIAGFVPSVMAGGKYVLYINTAKKQFAVSKRKDYIKENADLFKLRHIEHVGLIERNSKNSEGGDIFLHIDFSRGNIGHLELRVNEFSGLDVMSEEYKKAKDTAMEYIKAFKDAGVKERKFL